MKIVKVYKSVQNVASEILNDVMFLQLKNWRNARDIDNWNKNRIQDQSK